MCRQQRICRVGFLLLNFGDSSLSFELATTEELKTAKTGAVSQKTEMKLKMWRRPKKLAGVRSLFRRD